MNSVDLLHVNHVFASSFLYSSETCKGSLLGTIAYSADLLECACSIRFITKLGLMVLMTVATNLRLCRAFGLIRSGKWDMITMSYLTSSSKLKSLNSVNRGIFRGRMSFKLKAYFLPAIIWKMNLKLHSSKGGRCFWPEETSRNIYTGTERNLQPITKKS